MKEKIRTPPISSRPKKKPFKIDLGKRYLEALLELGQLSRQKVKSIGTK